MVHIIEQLSTKELTQLISEDTKQDDGLKATKLMVMSGFTYVERETGRLVLILSNRSIWIKGQYADTGESFSMSRVFFRERFDKLISLDWG